MSRRWLVVAAALLSAGYFVRTFPDHPVGMPVAVVTNLLIAAPSFLALGRWRGTRSALGLLLVLAAYAYVIESIGVLTGLPYGAFHYGAGLGPLAFGIVPLLLPLAYLPLVLAAVAAGGRATPHDPGRLAWRRVAVGALFLVLCDLALDPGAVRLGYWRYLHGGDYYGVPLSNFAGWLLTGAIAVGIAWAWLARDGATRAARVPVAPPPGLATSAFLTMAFWTGIAAWHGLAVPALAGAAVTALCWALGRARRRGRAADPSGLSGSARDDWSGGAAYAGSSG